MASTAQNVTHSNAQCHAEAAARQAAAPSWSSDGVAAGQTDNAKLPPQPRPRPLQTIKRQRQLQHLRKKLRNRALGAWGLAGCHHHMRVSYTSCVVNLLLAASSSRTLATSSRVLRSVLFELPVVCEGSRRVLDLGFVLDYC